MYSRIPIFRAFAEMACAGPDPSLAGLGLPGTCSRTPTQDHPFQPWHLLSIRALLPPPTLRHISSGAAPGPNPPTPRARPSHAGRRAAGHPGPGRPRLPRPRLGPASRVLLLLLWWRRFGLTRAGPGAGGWCGMQAREPARLPGGFRSGGGGASLPRRPAPTPPIGLPPAVYAKDNPALPQTTPPHKHYPVSSRAKASLPRPLVWPCGNLHASLEECLSG